MTPEYGMIDLLDIPESDKAALRESLANSVASFAATCTNLLQGRDSGCTTAKALRELMNYVMQPGSAMKMRDAARVGDIANEYRSSEDKLAIVCPDLDTRHWLARALQLALDFDRRPHNGVYSVRADPEAEQAGQIVVVAPESPLIKDYPRSLVFSTV